MDVLDRFDKLPEGVQEIIKEEVWQLEAAEDRKIWEQQHKHKKDLTTIELSLILDAFLQDGDGTGVCTVEQVVPYALTNLGLKKLTVLDFRFDWDYTGVTDDNFPTWDRNKVRKQLKDTGYGKYRDRLI